MPREVHSEWRETGARLYQIQLAEGKSGTQIADELDIEASTWSKYKKGQRELPVWLAAELRKRYGVSLDWLYTGEEYRNEEPFRQRLEAARQRQRAALKTARN